MPPKLEPFTVDDRMNDPDFAFGKTEDEELEPLEEPED